MAAIEVRNGYKFRRQHPLFMFIADFYCHRAKLVIVLDGSIHKLEEVKKYDEKRQQWIEQNEIKNIQFTNEAVINELAEVLKQINAELHNL